jgi:hypothetical protein
VPNEIREEVDRLRALAYPATRPQVALGTRQLREGWQQIRDNWLGNFRRYVTHVGEAMRPTPEKIWRSWPSLARDLAPHAFRYFQAAPEHVRSFIPRVYGTGATYGIPAAAALGGGIGALTGRNTATGLLGGALRGAGTGAGALGGSMLSSYLSTHMAQLPWWVHALGQLASTGAGGYLGYRLGDALAPAQEDDEESAAGRRGT